jgi:hypothetical protein
MNTNRLLNIATALIALTVCYILIFDETKDNKIFWGALALFFILLAVRARRARLMDKHKDR